MVIQGVDYSSLSLAEKATFVVFFLFVIFSLLALLFFVSLSMISLVTRRIGRYWNACFLLCSIALGGWMIFYAEQLYLDGGVMVFRNNVLLFWFLIFAVFVSAILGFGSPQRYIAILVLALTLVVFHVAVPGLVIPIWLIRQK